MGLAVLAWAIALGCVFWVWRYTRRLQQKALPSAGELAEEARLLAPSDASEHVFREVERLLSDARDEYRPRNELIIGLRRVALASGTGLSLLVLTRGVSLAQLPAALVTFAAGVAGA
ncbi:MAG TPA: hypothetical protein VFQ61_33080, partial [Polyangiaceae bacterium]|nr:hypothetical protein [Polyangiaceae bacterium]